MAMQHLRPFAPGRGSLDQILRSLCGLGGIRNPSASHRQCSARHYVSDDETSIPRKESVGPMAATVILDRLPVVIPRPPDWKLEYHKFSFELQQRSRTRYPQEFLDAAAEPLTDDTKAASGSDQSGSAASSSSLDSPVDVACFFEHPSRRTQADEENDTRSLQRALDRRLYLLVRSPAQGPAPDNCTAEELEKWTQDLWRFPEASYTKEESMRQCAEGLMAQYQGTSSELYFVGNAPCAHLQRSAPEQTAAESGTGEAAVLSTKRFFFLAHLVSGDITPSRAKDYAWLTKEEVLERLESDGEKKLMEVLLDR